MVVILVPFNGCSRGLCGEPAIGLPGRDITRNNVAINDARTCGAPSQIQDWIDKKWRLNGSGAPQRRNDCDGEERGRRSACLHRTRKVQEQAVVVVTEIGQVIREVGEVVAKTHLQVIAQIA